jgi:transcription elongation factor GreA
VGKEIYLTRDGRRKLIEELEMLKTRRPTISEEIGRAREHGDLKENAEYHAAKETLANIQKRIALIESKLSSAKLIEEQNIDRSKIYIGSKVKLKDLSDNEEYEYTIVDVEEANPAEHKISVQSPMSQGLLGHKSGEKVKVTLPGGVIEYKIIEIS